MKLNRIESSIRFILLLVIFAGFLHSLSVLILLKMFPNLDIQSPISFSIMFVLAVPFSFFLHDQCEHYLEETKADNPSFSDSIAIELLCLAYVVVLWFGAFLMTESLFATSSTTQSIFSNPERLIVTAAIYLIYRATFFRKHLSQLYKKPLVKN